jgi:hypothetical protein
VLGSQPPCSSSSSSFFFFVSLCTYVSEDERNLCDEDKKKETSGSIFLLVR